MPLREYFSGSPLWKAVDMLMAHPKRISLSRRLIYKRRCITTPDRLFIYGDLFDTTYYPEYRAMVALVRKYPHDLCLMTFRASDIAYYLSWAHQLLQYGPQNKQADFIGSDINAADIPDSVHAAFEEAYNRMLHDCGQR